MAAFQVDPSKKTNSPFGKDSPYYSDNPYPSYDPERAKQLVEERFTLRLMADRYGALYQQAISRKPVRAVVAA